MGVAPCSSSVSDTYSWTSCLVSLLLDLIVSCVCVLGTAFISLVITFVFCWCAGLVVLELAAVVECCSVLSGVHSVRTAHCGSPTCSIGCWDTFLLHLTVS